MAIASSSLFHQPRPTIVDCCADQGSSIVDGLLTLGWNAKGMSDAFDTSTWADLNIFNPPYKRGLVDKIIWHQIKGVDDGRFKAIAALLRNNFDFAKSRWKMFTHPTYAGQIHMMFRPYWSTERKSSPIHNYVWHIWRIDPPKTPIVQYWREP